MQNRALVSPKRENQIEHKVTIYGNKSGGKDGTSEELIKNVKKILFLTDMWSPRLTANSICVKNIASVLRQRGWEVYVNAFEGKTGQEDETVDGVHIEYTRPALPRRLITQAMFTSKLRKRKLIGFAGILLNRATRIIGMPCYPIVNPIFAKRWSRRVVEQIQKNNIDVVVSVNAPPDSIAAGYLAKGECPEVKWIAYYIDGGSNYGKEQSFLWAKQRLQKKAVKWENAVLAAADKIVVMEGHSAFYLKVLSPSNCLKLKVLNVPLFNTQQIQPGIRERTGEEIWTYMGSIRDGFYDPEKFFSWFGQYSKNHNAELHLYGTTNMEDYLRTRCNGKELFYHGSVSHDRVSGILANSDVLCYFRSERLDSVSGKFFEYLMYRKPIVYFGPKGDINWRQIEKYPLGIAIDQDTGEQTKTFDDIFNSNCVISDDLLRREFYTSTPEAFVDVVEKMEEEALKY